MIVSAVEEQIPASGEALIERPASLDDKLFRERLEWLIKRVGSVAALAQRSGVSDASLRQWVMGPNQPNRQRLVATAAAAQVSAAWLAAGVGEHYPLPWIERPALENALSPENFRKRMHRLVDRFKSRSALAREAGLSEATFRRWLEGPSEPRRTHCVALARAADVDLEWLLTGHVTAVEAISSTMEPDPGEPARELGARFVIHASMAFCMDAQAFEALGIAPTAFAQEVRDAAIKQWIQEGRITLEQATALVKQG